MDDQPRIQHHRVGVLVDVYPIEGRGVVGLADAIRAVVEGYMAKSGVTYTVKTDQRYQSASIPVERASSTPEGGE